MSPGLELGFRAAPDICALFLATFRGKVTKLHLGFRLRAWRMSMAETGVLHMILAGNVIYTGVVTTIA